MPELTPRYVLTEREWADLKNRFTYKAPKPDQVERYELIRSRALGLADMLATLCPQSREKSLAFTNLEQAVMWANAAIARNEAPGDD